jgi:hypothetical protein
MCSLTPRPRLTTWRTGSGQIWIAGPSLTLPWKVGGLVLGPHPQGEGRCLVLDLHSQEEDRDIPLLELNTLYFLSFSLFIIFLLLLFLRKFYDFFVFFFHLLIGR